MSNNKYRYYEVTTTKVVRALNQRDALATASRVKPLPGTTVLSNEQWVERVPAEVARQSMSA